MLKGVYGVAGLLFCVSCAQKGSNNTENQSAEQLPQVAVGISVALGQESLNLTGDLTLESYKVQKECFISGTWQVEGSEVASPTSLPFTLGSQCRAALTEVTIKTNGTDYQYSFKTGNLGLSTGFYLSTGGAADISLKGQTLRQIGDASDTTPGQVSATSKVSFSIAQSVKTEGFETIATVQNDTDMEAFSAPQFKVSKFNIVSFDMGSKALTADLEFICSAETMTSEYKCKDLNLKDLDFLMASTGIGAAGTSPSGNYGGAKRSVVAVPGGTTQYSTLHTAFEAAQTSYVEGESFYAFTPKNKISFSPVVDGKTTGRFQITYDLANRGEYLLFAFRRTGITAPTYTSMVLKFQ